MQLTRTKANRTTSELDECLALGLFLLCMSLPTTYELNVVVCLHACKSGPFGCTPKPRRQVDTVRTCTTQQLHDTDHATCTTQRGTTRSLSLSLTKIYYEDFVEFLKFNWFYNLLYNMRQNTLPYDLPIKNTHLQTDQKDPVTPYRGHKIRSTLKRIHKADQ